MSLISGTITEDGGGLYHLNAYDFDTNGNNVGFLFTASGAVPVAFSITPTAANPTDPVRLGLSALPNASPGAVSGMPTLGTNSGQISPDGSGRISSLPVSGQVFPASGMSVLVYSGQLSGQLVTAASGAFGTASLNSGQSVLVYSGQLSGQAVNLLSGNQVQVWSGTFVNVFSGQLSGQQVTAASGVFGTASLNSGQSVLVYSGQLSGQFVALPSGAISVNQFASGVIGAAIPNAVLQRDFTALSGLIASGLSGRCLVNAARKLINSWDLTTTSGFLTVYQEDDTSIAYTQSITVVSGAAPVTALDTK